MSTTDAKRADRAAAMERVVRWSGADGSAAVETERLTFLPPLPPEEADHA